MYHLFVSLGSSLALLADDNTASIHCLDASSGGRISVHLPVHRRIPYLMYLTKLTLPDVVRLVPQDLPAKSRVIFARKVDQQVLPGVRKAVQEQLAPYPGPVKYPFAFSTPKSRRFYFWKFKGYIPYSRKGDIQRAWVVTIDRRQSSGQVSILNTDPGAGRVYGPGNPLANYRQVPGHRNTGWGRDFARKIATVQELTVTLMITAWYQTVEESFKP